MAYKVIYRVRQSVRKDKSACHSATVDATLHPPLPLPRPHPLLLLWDYLTAGTFFNTTI